MLRRCDRGNDGAGSSNKNEGEGTKDGSNKKGDQVVKQEEKDGWVCVGHKDTLGGRTNMKVHGRRVTVIRLKGDKWSCIDSICYHAGGPLTEGSLKTIDNRICVQCPWHSYLVDIFSGEGLYMDLDRKYQSKGKRQRVHEVKVFENDHVYVKLDKNESNLPSDSYAYGLAFMKDDQLPQFPNDQSLVDW